MKKRSKLKRKMRASTRYKDDNGEMIHERDIVGCWLSSPWDEEVPIFRTFEVVKEPGSGRWQCKGVKACDEDDWLSNFKHIKKIKG